MVAVDEAITTLGDYHKELDANHALAAGNLYKDAQQRLREYGVTI